MGASPLAGFRFRSHANLSVMPDSQKHFGNCQTLCLDLSELVFETLEESEGRATVIRFQIPPQTVRGGDVLLVLSGSAIHFHGMISKAGDGWAVAADHGGSTLQALN